MMDIHQAIDRACADVGIRAPSDHREGRWIQTDTLDGKRGKGDGRIIINPQSVTAWNWRTGEKASVFIGDEGQPVDRKKFAERIEKDRRQKADKAERTARIAAELLYVSKLGTHPYLARKGFPIERVHIVDARIVADRGGDYLVPEGAQKAIVIPARIGKNLSSAQLIWEDGTKKFLAGGEMGGASFEAAQGRETWVCEGFATALSLRTALRGMNRADAILVAFSAYNISVVAKATSGRVWIAADNDKPLERFDGLGTGEHYARLTSKPYVMPEAVGADINDLHISDGIFAVQKLLKNGIRAGLAAVDRKALA